MSMAEFLYPLLPVAGLILNASIQIGYMRYFKKAKYIHSIAIGFTMGLIFIVTVKVGISFAVVNQLSDSTALFAVNLIIYSCSSYCYCAVIGLGVSSLRVRMLYELSLNAKGCSAEKILSQYNSHDILTARLNRLIANDHIVYKNERYYLKKYLVVALVFLVDCMKYLIFGRTKNDFL
jgi:hypothetical protein